MYEFLMAALLIGLFVLYFVCAAGADRREYEQDQRNKYGDNP